MTAGPGWPACTIAEADDMLTAKGAPFAMHDVRVNGHMVRAYVEAPENMRRVLDESRRFGDDIFLVYEEERISFEAHWRAANRFAHVLIERYGIGPGDRVALAMRNYPEWSASAFAIMAIGAVCVPLNAWEPGETLAAMLAKVGARVVIADGERRDRLHGRDHSAAVIVVRAAGEGATFEELVGPAGTWADLATEPAPFRPIAPDDTALIMFTSGTTGKAKAVPATHRAALTNLVHTQYRAARAALRRGEQWPPPPPAEQPAVLLPVPLFHVTGLHSALVPALARGHRLVLMYRWDIEKALEIVARERVQTLILVPTLVVQLIERIPKGGLPGLETVRLVTYGGAPATADLAAGVRSRFPGGAPAQGYGATETCSLVASNSHEDLLMRPGSVGTPVPCCEIRVVGEDGAAVGQGEAGELLIRGVQVFSGYWGEAEATAAVLDADGWYRTGDIVRVDEEGFLFVLDRKKDMIIRGGENIYCAEVEAAIAALPGVIECAVFGLPDRIMGEIVAATIVAHEGVVPDTRSVRTALKDKLPGFKLPERVMAGTAPLPRTATGKVLKGELRRAMMAQTSITAGQDRSFPADSH